MKCTVVCKFLTQELPDISEELMAKHLTATPQGSEKYSIILLEELSGCKRMIAMNGVRFRDGKLRSEVWPKRSNKQQ